MVAHKRAVVNRAGSIQPLKILRGTWISGELSDDDEEEGGGHRDLLHDTSSKNELQICHLS